MIGKETPQGKFFSMKMFESYIRNRQIQVAKFEEIDSQQGASSQLNPFSITYEEDFGKTAKVDRSTNYYGCVNGKYPVPDSGIPVGKANEENHDNRIEMEKFSKVKSKTLKEIDDAIQSSQNMSCLKNTVLALKILRRNIFKVDTSSFSLEDLTKIWSWEDIYLSIAQ